MKRRLGGENGTFIYRVKCPTKYVYDFVTKFLNASTGQMRMAA
jgi:hypothetical protein